MVRKAPTPIYALLLAAVGGTLLAVGHYLAGVVLVLVAAVLLGLWQFAEARGDDDRGVY